MRIHAILTAAGSGKRFRDHSKNNSLPKQFLKLNGKPVILYSLSALQKSKMIEDIIITSDKRYFDLIHSIAAKNKITKLTALVEGGRTRFISVRNAFIQLNGNKNDLVLIHDAVRPAVTTAMIDNIIRAARKYGDVIYGTKICETVKKEKNSFVAETLDREHLWAIQTPQIFRFDTLKNSYNISRKKDNYTDEASMVEEAGYKVRLLEGNPDNIKITTKRDFTILTSYLR